MRSVREKSFAFTRTWQPAIPRSSAQPTVGSVYCQSQTDCFFILQLFSVAGHARYFKLGSKPGWLYVNRMSYALIICIRLEYLRSYKCFHIICIRLEYLISYICFQIICIRLEYLISYICVQIICIRLEYLISYICFQIICVRLDGLVCWVLWHISLCRLFNAKSILCK